MSKAPTPRIIDALTRADLVEALSFCAPSLSSESSGVVVAFLSFCFDGGRVVAHNDVTATCHPLKTRFKGVVPGHPLLKFLTSCSGDEVELTQSSEASSVSFKCGQSKLTLAYQDEYVLDFPRLFGNVVKEVGGGFFDALEICSRGVADAGLLDWSGGVLFEFDSDLTMYSVGNKRQSMTQFKLEGFNVETGFKITLPVMFCKLAVAAAKKMGVERAKIAVTDRYSVVYFDNGAAVFGRAIEDDATPHIAQTITRHLEEVGKPVPISISLNEALGRAASLWSSEGTCSLSVSDNVLKLDTKVGSGSLADEVKLRRDHPDITVNIQPKLILRMLDRCGLMTVTDRCVVLSDGKSLTYLTANPSS